MLVNNNAYINHVEFVSYTGKYPNLCRGVLTLKIDGEEVRFGHDYDDYDWKTDSFNDDNYDSFWSSSGNCGFTNNYSNSYVYNGSWIIDVECLPNEYKEYALEIDEVFNIRVPHGCCGGCL